MPEHHRIAVLADIHANLHALRAALDDASAQAPTQIVVAGDLVGAGPYPLETVALLRSRQCVLIRGNSDTYPLKMADGRIPREQMNSLQWQSTRWLHDHLDGETLAFLASLPDQCVLHPDGTDPILLVHGSPFSPIDPVFPTETDKISRIAAHLAEPVLVCAHTHQPWIVRRAGRLLFNPGPVSGSNDGDQRAHYALLTWSGERWEVELRRAAYDLDAMREAFEACGLLAEGGFLAELALFNNLTGREVVRVFLDHAEGLAAEMGYAGAPYLPDPIWEQAVATFRPQLERIRQNLGLDH